MGNSQPLYRRPSRELHELRDLVGVARNSKAAGSRVSKPANFATSSASPIWKSPTQQVLKPALDEARTSMSASYFGAIDADKAVRAPKQCLSAALLLLLLLTCPWMLRADDDPLVVMVESPVFLLDTRIASGPLSTNLVVQIESPVFTLDT